MPELHLMEKEIAWIPQEQAEGQTDRVQPVPGTMIRGKDHTDNIFQRTRRARTELSSRTSLVVGGQIDRGDGKIKKQPSHC